MNIEFFSTAEELKADRVPRKYGLATFDWTVSKAL